MQRLSIRLLAVFTVLALTGTGFSKKVPAIAKSHHSHREPSYYWFSALDDSYYDYTTVAAEEWEQECDFGVLVNQNPTGGTLLDEGYINDSDDPHNQPPYIFLYGHF